jgi:FdhD protein
MRDIDARAIRSYPGRSFRYCEGASPARPISVAVEKAINIVYGDTPYAVMMTTPADLEDFAVGFSLTEGVIVRASEVRGVEIAPQNDGYLVSVSLSPDALRRHMARRRNLSGRTSCGLCGLESLDQIPSAAERVRGSAPGGAAIEAALRALKGAQPLFAETRATHAAAWCATNGDLAFVREDVGRHNALDKTIGACVRAGAAAQDGFMLVTSRCSFEMVEKAAIFGAPALVSVSAPTSLAIDRARDLGLAMIAVARDDGAILFADDRP